MGHSLNDIFSEDVFEKMDRIKELVELMQPISNELENDYDIVVHLDDTGFKI